LHYIIFIIKENLQLHKMHMLFITKKSSPAFAGREDIYFVFRLKTYGPEFFAIKPAKKKLGNAAAPIIFF